LAQRAEAAGWDGVFLWDHVLAGDLPIVDTWTALAAIAASTSRIRLGPTVTPLPRRRPWIVARQASTVSRLARGRLIVGVGLGSDESGDFSRFGEETDVAKRAALLDDGLATLRATWGDEPFPIPVWTAASPDPPPGVLRRAAACDGIFPISDHTLSPDELAALMARLPDLDRPFDVAIAGNASAAWETPNPDGADLDALHAAGATWWMESLIHFDPLEQSLDVVDAGPPT
jgi:alkanesulfonate monooxygenase SsuD/methylene tetrahydromethanopterin reductase-like flavin-dependent oxidoreductase (luciferase family)